MQRRRAVEVEVRFAGSLLEVRRVAVGRSVRIGTAPGVDIPVALSLYAFPVVEHAERAVIVRRPAGTSARVTVRGATTAVVESALELGEGMAFELAVGAITIRVACVAAVPVVPRRRGERRPLAYGVASIIAHLLVVALAMSRLPIERLPAPREVVTVPLRRPVAIHDLDPPRPRPPVEAAEHRAEPTVTRQATRSGPAARAGADDRPPQGVEAAAGGDDGSGGAGMLGALAGMGALLDPDDVARKMAAQGPRYDEAAANARGFGGGRRFDPSKDPAFDSVKTGPYQTVSSGRAAGAHYRLRGEVPRPELMALSCDDDACKVTGPLTRFVIRDAVEADYPALIACYRPVAHTKRRVELTLGFSISTAGKAHDLKIEGDAQVGACVARLVRRARFPAGTFPTRVSYPIALWRNAR